VETAISNRPTLGAQQFQRAQAGRVSGDGEDHGRLPRLLVDHIKPLKRGGADRLSNMQWQTTAEAKAKDKWE
jgi:hypothetical protein